MPSSYVQHVQQPDVAILEHFTQLLRLLDPDRGKRDALVESAKEIMGEQEDYMLAQVKDDIQQDPLLFFKLVSKFLGDPPRPLKADDRKRVAEGLRVPVRTDEHLVVDYDGIWQRELVLDDDLPLWVRINRYGYWLGADEIVPMPVLDYLKPATVCYRGGLFPAALVLGAIALEACLREVLNKRGLDKIAPAYKSAQARVDAYLCGGQPQFLLKMTGASLALEEHFMTKTPRGPGFLDTITFRIRRVEKGNAGSSAKVYLTIETNDPQNVDLLSSNERENTPGKANKFREFNERAEQTLFREEPLPEISADVIRRVRNYVVHWDESKLAEELPDGQTVGQYITDRSKVRSTLTHIVDFISGVYYKLREVERDQRLCRPS